MMRFPTCRDSHHPANIKIKSGNKSFNSAFPTSTPPSSSLSHPRHLTTLTLMLVLACVPATSSKKMQIPIGTIVSKAPDWQDVFDAMNVAIDTHTTSNSSSEFDLKFFVDNIDTTDAFKLTKIICRQLQRGTFSLMGSVDPEAFETLHSFANAFEMPFITPWFPERKQEKEDGSLDFAIQMQPDYHQGVVSMILHYKWTSIIYIYQSLEGLHRLQKIYKAIPRNGFGSPNFYVQTAKKVDSADEAIEFLKQLEFLDRESVKHIVLDTSTSIAKQIIIKHVQTIVLGRRNYHYLMSGLVLDEMWDGSVAEFGAINITGFRIVHYGTDLAKNFFARWGSPSRSRGSRESSRGRSISAEGALAYDVVNLLINTFNSLVRQSPDLLRVSRRGKGKERLECGDMTQQEKPQIWEHGQTILRQIKTSQQQGLTGLIAFDRNGRRHNYTLDVLEMNQRSELVQIGRWSDVDGLVLSETRHSANGRRPVTHRKAVSETYVMTTILEEPYMMRAKPKKGEVLTGNNRYEGYCKDLADLITRLTGIQFVIKPVNDSKYGSPDPYSPGGWNGMVGELVRHEAEIAIAPLTINSQREQVADFTKPFMSIGVSIMIKQPMKLRPGIFTFFQPLSAEIWMCVAFAYIGVSIVLFLVSRFSPYEWQIEESMAGTTVSNHFSVINSLWFALGAFMQQGIDITPRSISGRIVGGVWWFFSLILISSYTANLAAFLTVDRINHPIESADDLAAQTEIEYGALDGGSTLQFLENSKISVYNRMWEFMASKPTVLTRTTYEGIERVRESKGKYAFLIESSTNEYVNERMPCDTMKVGKNLDSKGYGIATAKGSGLREIINLAVLNLTENGDLAKLKNRWWFDRSECSKDKDLGGKTGLTLSHVAGIFYILICGLVLAMVTALLEFCYKASTESKKAKVPMSDAMKNKARLALSGGRDIDRIMLYGDSSAL